MTSGRGAPGGHYAALGVSPGAPQRAIEVAFASWRRRFEAGEVDSGVWRLAEAAYHVLSHPTSRARHDRQLGLCPHPAWAASSAPAAREGVRQAVALLGQGRPTRARALLERAVLALPEDPTARSYLAVALARSGGSLHAAARHAEHACARRPGQPAFLFNLAEVYAAAGLGRRALAARATAWGATALAALTRTTRPGM